MERACLVTALRLEDFFLRLSPDHFDEPAYQSCYAYWLRLKNTRFAPAWREWQWSEISPALVPYFVVVDVSYEPLDFRYRFWGTANTRMHGLEMTGTSVSDIRSPVTRKSTFEHYAGVVEHRQAIAALYKMQTHEHHISHSQIALRMPMSDDGHRVDQIISFIDWRKNEDQIRSEHEEVYGAPPK